MDIVKYFYEEPASLEVLASDEDADARRRSGPALSLEALLHAPRYHRGYLAGTDLAAGRVGLTAIAHPEAFSAPMWAAFGGGVWTACDARGRVEVIAGGDVRALLEQPDGWVVLAGSDGALAEEQLSAVAGDARRRGLPALRSLLGAARVVLFPEPAHHGHDWSLFSAQPMRAALVAAFEQHPANGVRRFALPFQRARSEEKFYFEQYDLTLFAAYEVG